MDYRSHESLEYLCRQYEQQIQIIACPERIDSPYLQIAGSDVSVDGAGNIYVGVRDNQNSANATINVYSPVSPTGAPQRSPARSDQGQRYPQ